MPSEFSPANREQSGRNYPVEEIVESIGEDPGRWLDRDLFDHGQVRLEERDVVEWDQSSQRVVRDSNVSAPGEMIRDRIAGIDELGVAASWMQVERQLERTLDGGRDVVIQLLRDRIAELEAHGERDLDGRNAEELRELGVEAYEAAAPKDAVVYRGPDGELTGRSSGTTAEQKLAAMADGGEEE